MESEFRKFESAEDGWTQQIISIESKSNNHPVAIGRQAKYINLNRYFNVIPYDNTRVKLSRLGEDDYINANYVTISEATRRYILTQGPLATTVSHFWLMVWEQKTSLIVMLNRLAELSIVKCERYWPEEENTTDTYDDVKLTVTLEKIKVHKHYVIKTIKLYDMKTKKSRQILHYNYTAWPDHGSPESPTPILRLLVDVRKTGGLDKMDEPCVVHCSAGIGRSGTFVLIDAVLCMIENQGSTETIDISQTLLKMRDCRKGLIQTGTQLRFAYMTILYAKSILERASKVQFHMTSCPSSSVSPPKGKSRKSSKRRKASSQDVNIFQKKLFIQAFDDIDSDTGDEIFYDLMKPTPNQKKPRSDESSPDKDFKTVLKLPPLSSLTRPDESASSMSSISSLGTESALLRRREQNKRIQERTEEMKRKMNEDTARRKGSTVKKSALYATIGILFTSIFIYCVQSQFS